MTFKQVGHHCEAFGFDGVVVFVTVIFDKLRVTSLSGMSYASFGITHPKNGKLVYHSSILMS